MCLLLAGKQLPPDQVHAGDIHVRSCGKRVKCPKCAQPLAVPGPQPAAARPAGDLDLEQLLGPEAGVPEMPSIPLPALRKTRRPSNTRLIVGLSVGAGAAVLMLLLVFLLWPSGEDKELAKDEAAPNEQSQEAGEATPATTATGPGSSDPDSRMTT